jgi:hypothetical protein
MPKILVYSTALFFICYGALFIVLPAEFALLVTGSAPNETSATVDFRATYGGLQLAVGVIIFHIARHQKDLSLALTIVSTSLLFMAVGRTVGILTDGSPNLIMYLYLCAEIVFGLFAIALKKSLKSDKLRFDT